MKTILCYGDSNTYGYNPENGLRYARSVRWPGRLQHLLGPDYYVIEEGCNGRTTSVNVPVEPWKSGLPYLKPCLNSHKPVDLVILMLGSNDLKRMFHVNAEQIAEQTGKFVDVIHHFCKEKQGYAPKVILVSPPEIGAGIAKSPFAISFGEDAVAQSRKFSHYYKKIADKKGCVFFDAARWIYPSDTDSLHLTAVAHKVLAEKLAETVREVF